jgi:type I restriction enzyme R subunit
MSLHPHNIAQKTEVMVEHFRQVVQHQIGGRAKAMVVTSSRLHAVRYRQAFDKYLKEHNYSDIGVLVAFSGTVRDPDTGAEFTEVQMNGGKIPEKGLRDHFKTDEFKLLLVANKYQTGFDEPLLQTMYVDKRLSGIQAVQTLSRLNRMYPGKEDTFVLDFVNDTDEIQRSFQPYYEQTTVAEQADPNQLYELQHKLDGTQVYFNSEVEAFCRVFYSPKGKQAATDQGQMVKHLDPAVDRFRALDEEQQEEFRTELQAYTRLYAFLSQVMPFADPDLEKLYTFGRFLLTKLPQSDAFKPLVLDDDVALRYYRLQKLGEQNIVLMVRENVGLKGPTEVGTGKAKDPEAPLSEIIELLNERFGTEFTKADQLLFDQFVEDAKADPKVVQQATANPFDNFELAMRTKLEAMMIDRMDRNESIVTKYLNDPGFREVVDRELSRRLYEEISVAP